MSRLATLLTITSALVACGPGTKSDGTGPKGDGAGGGASDESFQYDTVALQGTYFAPEGLDRPDMLIAQKSGKKITLDKQRAAYKKAKPADKADEALVLATMLYQQGAAESDDARRTALWDEARKVYVETVAVTTDPKAKAILLHNIACLAYEMGDQPGVVDALTQSVAAAPDDPRAGERRGYLAYYAIRVGKNAEAKTAVEGIEPSKDQPELAYAIAWTAWRTGDHARARRAILAAAEGWKRKDTLPALRRDIALLSSRTGASADEAVALAKAYGAHGTDPAAAAYDTLAYMEQGYVYAGRYADLLPLVEKLLALRTPKPIELVKYRFEQAEAAKALARPAELLAHAQEAVAALNACGADCKEIQAAPKLVFNYARLAANLYATSGDDTWYQPAKDLYALYLTIPGITDQAQVQAEIGEFEKTRTNLMSGRAKDAGKYDKGVIAYLIDARRNEIQSCYDEYLQRDPKLAGNLAVTFEVAQSGEVAGASSEPAAGEEGVAGVAACAVERIRAWKFPARIRTGLTRIAVAYALQPAPTK